MSIDVKFSMDPDWERNLMRAVDGGMHQLAHDFQRAIDGLRSAYEGKPVEQIRPALQQAWANVNDGAQITEPHLTEYAEAIRIGRPIEIKYTGIEK
jgi:hypothetical protein